MEIKNTFAMITYCWKVLVRVEGIRVLDKEGHHIPFI